MEPLLSKEELSRIQELLPENPSLQLLKTECERAGVSLYLVEGALRNRLLGFPCDRDLDLLACTTADKLESIRQTVLAQIAEKSLTVTNSIDLTICCRQATPVAFKAFFWV